MTKRIICVVLMVAVYFAAMLALGYFCPVTVSFLFAALAGVYVGNGITKAARWLTNGKGGNNNDK